MASTKPNNNEVFKLVLSLTNENRDEALAELSKKREMYPDLAPILWFSVGTVRRLFSSLFTQIHHTSFHFR
jgi:CCR4-NOT transcription complex subunit 9